MDAETLHPTWAEVGDIVTDLVDRVAANGLPDVIVGIARGGLIPAVIMAQALGIRDVRSVAVIPTTANGRDAPKTDEPEVSHPLSLGDLDTRDVLVVDDIAGSGETLKTAVALVDAGTTAPIPSSGPKQPIRSSLKPIAQPLLACTLRRTSRVPERVPRAFVQTYRCRITRPRTPPY